MTKEETARRRAWAAVHFNQPNLTDAELDCATYMPSENFSDGWDKGAEWAIANQWQPFCAENAPLVGEEVLIRGEQGDIIMAKMIEQRVGNGIGHVLVWHPEVRCKVTHWLPIPPLNPEKEER